MSAGSCENSTGRCTEAVSSGVSVLKWKINASQLEPSTQRAQPRRPVLVLAGHIHETSDWPSRPPPGAPPIPRTTSAEMRVALAPARRVEVLPVGRDMYGGLQSTCPNRSPSTGCQRSPKRKSTLSSPFSCALKAA